jgi:hypothetical protein
MNRWLRSHTRLLVRLANRSNNPYIPLDPQKKEIRLATLAPGMYDDDLVIQLRVESLSQNQKLEYEALSYVWGSIENPCVAQINGKHVLITINLECALRHLRYQDRSRVFWIDALCINQADIPERNSQVQMMGSIYRDASAVAIWLGPGTEEEEEVIRKIGRPSDWNIQNIDILIRVCQRPWFRRVWV